MAMKPMADGGLNQEIAAAAEIGRSPVSKQQITPKRSMSRLTRDGTAETVSRDQMLRRKRGQENTVFIFPVQLNMSRIG